MGQKWVRPRFSTAQNVLTNAFAISLLYSKWLATPSKTRTERIQISVIKEDLKLCQTFVRKEEDIFHKLTCNN